MAVSRTVHPLLDLQTLKNRSRPSCLWSIMIMDFDPEAVLARAVEYIRIGRPCRCGYAPTRPGEKCDRCDLLDDLALVDIATLVEAERERVVRLVCPECREGFPLDSHHWHRIRVVRDEAVGGGTYEYNVLCKGKAVWLDEENKR